MVEAVEGGAGRSVVEVLEYTNSAASCRRQQQDGAADDDDRRRGLRLMSRSGQGWRWRRLQQVSHLDQGWRRRLPSGTSAALSAQEWLEVRRRIECLLDEDWRIFLVFLIFLPFEIWHKLCCHNFEIISNTCETRSLSLLSLFT